MSLRETFFTDAPDEEYGGAVNAIAQNKTLYIDQFTNTVNEPELLQEAKNIKEVFEYFQPEVAVEFEDEAGNPVLKTLKFREMKDFDVNNGNGQLVANSPFLLSLKANMEANVPNVKTHKKLFGDNIAIALDSIKNLEISYRTLDAFYNNAGTDKVTNLRLINVDKPQLNNSNSKFIQEIDTVLKRAFDRLSLSDSYSIVAMPGYVFEDTCVLRMWAEMVHKYHVLLLSDHADEWTYDDLVEDTERYKDSDVYLQNVMLCTNWLLGREAEQLACEEEGVYIPPSGALAGMLYNESYPVSEGRSRVSIQDVKGVRLDLQEAELVALADNQVIPMFLAKGGVMAFNDATLFNGDNVEMKEYPVVRVFEWVKKVLLNLLNDEVLQNWDYMLSPDILKTKIQNFLNANKGYGRLFQDYTIEEPSQDLVTKNITVDLSITPYFVAKKFIVKLSANKTEKIVI